MTENAYAQLEARFAELNALEGALATLHWDSEVMLPPGSVDVRAEQLAALSAVHHRQLTDPALADLLAAAEEEQAALSDWQRANLREMRHHYTHSAALPEALVQALSTATTRSEHAWRQARADNDYAGFQPYLAEVLELVREVAAIKAEALGCCPYDALLDQYDPGMRSAEIDRYFASLEAFLPDFVAQVTAHQASRATPALEAAIPVADQQRFSRHMMQRLGFDFSRGRADVSTHPFCGGAAGDIRLTSRYDDANFIEGLYATFHETGHALYEMGLPEAWRQQPVGRARGMSLHESQSLLLEMQVGLSPSFTRHVAAQMREQLPDHTEGWTAEKLTNQLTRVQPSLIRVTADEVTYPLHILLRYELEKALLSGDLPLDELPAAWNDGMEKRLGIRPPSDREGCLQDTHWPGGAIGYFPTYTIGAMIAAQLMDAARTALPELDVQLERGDIAALLGWLRTHVHAQGSLLSTPDLVAHATGKSLDAALYIRHLKERYLNH